MTRTATLVDTSGVLSGRGIWTPSGPFNALVGFLCDAGGTFVQDPPAFVGVDDASWIAFNESYSSQPIYWLTPYSNDLGGPAEWFGVRWNAAGRIWPYPGIYDSVFYRSDLPGVHLKIQAWMIDSPFDLTPPQAAHAHRTTAQTLTTAVLTAVVFDASFVNEGPLWEGVTHPSRLTVARSGRFIAAAAVEFATNSTGDRGLWIRKNGSDYLALTQVDANSYASHVAISVQTPGPVDLVAGDYIELIARQRSGGDLDIVTNTLCAPDLGIHEIR